MTKRKLQIWIVLLIALQALPSIAMASSSFFDERYRGWFWFENKQKNADDSARNQNNRAADITPMEAKAEIEQFAKELEELKFMMLARPSPENVKAYRDKEKQMWDQAETLHDAWDMANLLYPEQRDLINNPVNVHGVKAKRAMQEEENTQKIKELAKDFDLVLFFSDSCKYCALLSPVLKSFGEQYGFRIDAVSSNNVKHEYFKTANAPQLIERLGVTAFPTVIAVSHDSKTAFELIRGYVSISELEEYSLLAAKYLEEQKNKEQVGTKLISEIIAK
jgi:conjugal transfer pilus assembly protein TraF